ncbi:MAG: DUF6732 family protein [Nitratireductor sp.]
MRILLGFSFVCLMPSAAFAHLGHVGELAGHGHLIAVGAGVVAVGLAALLGKKPKDAKDADAENDEDTITDEDELEGATS